METSCHPLPRRLGLVELVGGSMGAPVRSLIVPPAAPALPTTVRIDVHIGQLPCERMAVEAFDLLGVKCARIGCDSPQLLRGDRFPMVGMRSNAVGPVAHTAKVVASWDGSDHDLQNTRAAFTVFVLPPPGRRIRPLPSALRAPGHSQCPSSSSTSFGAHRSTARRMVSSVETTNRAMAIRPLRGTGRPGASSQERH